jgi:acyl-CoA synthetase (AMP-forming)/AMP-acid ligase II
MKTPRPDVLDVLAHGSNHPLRSVVALEDSRRSVEYRSLASAVGAAALLLADHGVRPADRVVVSLPNSVSSVEAFLGCAALGAIWVGVNPAAPLAEKMRQCDIVTPRVVIGAADAYVPAGAELITVGDDGALVAPGPDTHDSLPARPELDAPCSIAFSSGTTGAPKALVHSRAGLSLAAAALAATTVRSDDRVGVVLPCSIHNVMIVGPLASLIAGASTVLLDRFSARDVAAECRARRLTMVRALEPAAVYDLTHDDEISADDLLSLREAGTGAAGLAEPLRDAFEAKFGIRLSGSYGLSEAPAAVCSEDTGRPRRLGSSGVPLPHVAISVRDAAGISVPTGEVGEMWVRAAEHGPWAGQYRGLLGRWEQGRLVRSSFDERGFATGDTGHIDDGGALHVVGRAADVLTRGGVTVIAAELEAIIGEFAGVREAAAIGRPHDRLGEQIIAFVEAEAGQDLDPASIRRQAAIELSHGKVPDEVIILDRLPRNAMGKIARADLIALAQKGIRE